MFQYKKINIQSDVELWDYVTKEIDRQEQHIELIASENYASIAVMQAQGSLLTNKYAEGYPRKRYYGGCDFVDCIEQLAIDRAKKLFHADYANVQPHSGSQANFAVFIALLNPGDTILGMDLSHGGHLTHGASINVSGKIYNTITYGLNEFGDIDYLNIEKLAKKYKPKMIIGGFSSFSRYIDWKKFRSISDSCGAYFLADMAHVAGLVAVNLYPNPIKYADVVTTTTHKTLSGPRGGLILSSKNDEVLYKKINSAVFPGIQGGPLMHVIAAKAIAFREALHPSFKKYQQQILKNAKIMSKIFIEHNFKIISGGTDNHLFLIDLTNKNVTGKFVENILELANITVNKNSVPNDKNSPFITSGIRIGTPAITRRGFKEEEATIVTNWIVDIIHNHKKLEKILNIKTQVLELCEKYPVYK
ncbi:serine hydroxymethyltransferase [Buchnera aphidicola]|uniref:Serine hydroxymethyltransferase n=1 Tax=Buchnera aphidicola (Sarucallis kahawaluokalani) TaxID=1241878 RepID=A0A4D6YI12_9GAMM|nr:serine hydroxymethyltransferase [Buchnera aphidicola]QCI25991.1 serine hydroxymethyltransferase [Buchnera aphidicola (Sarucallis kahawaluokalani)]